jgi:hypothetical protein
MISIKDFKVGQTAYLLSENTRPLKLKTVEVQKIGRKYVTVKYGWGIFKYGVEDYLPEALVEQTEFGNKDLLFVSEQAAADYLEKIELEKWLQNAVQRYGRLNFSIEQLRKVKAILEEGEKQKCSNS